MRISSSLVGLSSFSAILTTVAASPIITRHDRADDEYRALGARYADVHVEMRLPRSDGTQGPPGNGLGTLIGPEWVITASHVAVDLPTGLREPGSTVVHTVDVGGRPYLVRQVFVHPEYLRDPTSRHDIALVKLAEPVSNARYVHLYRADDELGREVVFIGTGHSGTGRTGPTARDRVLRGATNRVAAIDPHRLIFVFSAPDSSAATHLEGISGPGDSGNAALIDRNDSLFVAGVGCCQRHEGTEGVYGVTEVYPRVSSHLQWLDSVMVRSRGKR